MASHAGGGCDSIRVRRAARMLYVVVRGRAVMRSHTIGVAAMPGARGGGSSSMPHTGAQSGITTVDDLARAVVRAVVPQQIEAYGEVADAWWAGDLDDTGALRGGWHGGAVRSGLP